MARIHGIVCDGCGVSDVVSAEEKFYEDKIPRNGWMTLNVWHGSDNPHVGPDIHACSVNCLRVVADKLEELSEQRESEK